ncbi:hypothetical protein HQN89_13260 [Paenibacillus frigoriresistens]|uniref:hypothetical protein n=1 Tax=Paenibacillus alginolyticus TaxID=59839 RepID=UPI001564B28B|nr:hypothetical protein [Paenibacillus frigoriresistens]NRF91981.1 hypothetical protein [Paenibacillus frigoriresistens]
MMSTPSVTPRMDSSNKWMVLLIVNMGTFMSTLDVGIVNVCLWNEWRNFKGTHRRVP